MWSFGYRLPSWMNGKWKWYRYSVIMRHRHWLNDTWKDSKDFCICNETLREPKFAEVAQRHSAEVSWNQNGYARDAAMLVFQFRAVVMSYWSFNSRFKDIWRSGMPRYVSEMALQTWSEFAWHQGRNQVEMYWKCHNMSFVTAAASFNILRTCCPLTVDLSMFVTSQPELDADPGMLCWAGVNRFKINVYLNNVWLTPVFGISSRSLPSLDRGGMYQLCGTYTLRDWEAVWDHELLIPFTYIDLLHLSCNLALPGSVTSTCGFAPFDCCDHAVLAYPCLSDIWSLRSMCCHEAYLRIIFAWFSIKVVCCVLLSFDVFSLRFGFLCDQWLPSCLTFSCFI